jgi:hypothetical protein
MKETPDHAAWATLELMRDQKLWRNYFVLPLFRGTEKGILIYHGEENPGKILYHFYAGVPITQRKLPEHPSHVGSAELLERLVEEGWRLE